MKTTRVLLLVLCFAFATSVRADEVDAAKVLKQTPENGSLPLWTKPGADARHDLGELARDRESGVFLVGFPKKGKGTAWCVSTKHRLLITNAHVADIFHESGGKMLAIPNGSSQIYTVEKVWYHPGVRRYLKENEELSVRSIDPKDGDVDPLCPDLAVMQLSRDGPDLTVEFALATAGELKKLYAQPAAMVGFPGTDTIGWPELGEKAGATYHDGVISRLTDFQLSVSAPAAELQCVQHTMSSWSGFSGSPVFLSSGRVAAVHNMARTEKSKQSDVLKSIPHGIRADCVIELLVYHKLDQKVSFKIDSSNVALDRWTQPDERTEKARADLAKAMELLKLAKELYRQRDYQKVVEKCSQALQIAPNLPYGYKLRGTAIFAFCCRKKGVKDLLTLALKDAVAAEKLQPTDPQCTIQKCRVLSFIAFDSGDKTLYAPVIEELSNLLTSEGIADDVRAEAYSARAFAHNKTGKKKAALCDHNEAVRLSPTEPQMFAARAAFLEDAGRDDEARIDFARAQELRQKK